MSQLDGILQRARAPGQFVERKRFSLSRGKAIEKMREFSLRDPRQYVTELIQSAVLAGATYIAVDVDSDDVLVAWVGGKPMGASELESIFDYLFVDRASAEHRHLSQLAVGLNAMLQRNPKVLRVESGDGSAQGTVRFDMDAAGRGVMGRPEMGLAGTYVLAEFRVPWYRRFASEESVPEAALIEERCRFSPVPILLNGDAPFGYKSTRKLGMPGCPSYLPFDDGDRYGVVGVSPTTLGESDGFSIVIGGVRITTLDLPELGATPRPGGGRITLTGVIGDDLLRKTADHSDIVKDERLTQMLHAVQPHATELIRRITSDDYEPPDLPRLVAGATVTEELPENIEQLAPRPLLTHYSLERLPRNAPVFRVQPDDKKALEAAADPVRFPYPVLVLNDSHLPSLDDLVPDLAVHQLSSHADVEFVRRMMERRQRTREITVPYACPGKPDLTGELTIRLYLEGVTPLLGDPADGDVCVLVASAGRTAWCGMTPLGLHGISVELVMETRTGAEAVVEALVELDEVIVSNAWRLLPGDEMEDGDRALLRDLLAAHACPHFVEEAGGIRLDVSLPESWGDVRAHFRGTRLLETAEGPLTFDGFLALQGTDRVVRALDATELDGFEALEHRFGFGHLHHPDRHGEPLCVVGQVHDEWRWWPVGEGPDPATSQIIWLAPVYHVELDDEQWDPIELGIPGFGAAVRMGGSATEESWKLGFELMARCLGQRVREHEFEDMTADDQSMLRVMAMGRQALLRLARRLGRFDTEPTLWCPGVEGWRSPGEMLAEADFAVAPRFGPAVSEPNTVLLSRDELQTLVEEVHRPRLRYDDAPEVWESLSVRDHPGWLAQHQVRIPGLRGWLGLRRPYDGTTGVFIQAAGIRVALPSVDADVPCHGLLRLVGGGTEPTDGQMDLLVLARQQLYHELAMAMEGDLSAEDREAADRYRDDLVNARRAHGVAAAATTPLDRSAKAGTSVRRELEQRLSDACEGVLGENSLMIHLADGKDSDPPVALSDRFRLAGLAINRANPAARQALMAPGPARELLLLEMARLVSRWGRQKGLLLDLPSMQRLLVARRLGTGG